MVNNFEQLKQIADLISAQFGPSTEVVLHDFTGELDHTIVYIVNGHVTGRTRRRCTDPVFSGIYEYRSPAGTD